MLEKKKSRLIKFYVLAVIILLIFFYYLGFLAKGEKYFLNFLSQIQNNTYSFLTKLNYSFINYQEAQYLKKENSELKRQYNELVYVNSQLSQLESENERLRNILNFHEEQEFNYLVAKVIGRDFNRVNTLIINKGKQGGLKEGYAVVVDQGIIIGKVIETKDNVAIILLLTDKLSQLAVSTISNNKTTGLAQGEFGLSIKVELIPQNIEIKEGDVIITSGLESNIPRGLVIGQVNRIISQENDLFKSVTIRPLVDYDEITILSIIIPNNFQDD